MLLSLIAMCFQIEVDRLVVPLGLGKFYLVHVGVGVQQNLKNVIQINAY